MADFLRVYIAYSIYLDLSCSFILNTITFYTR